MGLKKKHEEHENLERWLVSYADFITLLFAFFTVLYALSQTDKAKYKDAIENIQRAFLNAGGIFPLKGSPFTPFDKAPDKGSLIPPDPVTHGEFTQTQREALSRLEEEIKGLYTKMTGLGLSPGDVEVIRTDNGFRIRLGEFLLFKPGSDKIKRENIGFLYEIGKRLTKLNLPVQVEGHTDNAPSSTEESNWQLSMSRAYNVVRFMVEGVHFPPNRISLAGFGDTQPVAENDTTQGRQRNRRVELTITAPDRAVETLDFEGK